MSPPALLILSWLGMAGAAWAGFEAEASGSSALMAIAALCGAVVGLGQSPAFVAAVNAIEALEMAALRLLMLADNDDGPA